MNSSSNGGGMVDECEEVMFRIPGNHSSSRRMMPKFLVSLWEMLSDPNCQNEVGWSQDGSFFIIRNPKRFAEQVLPMYFKHNNMNSFLRQLSNYEFSKVFLLSPNGRPLKSWHRRTPYSGLLAFQNSNFCRDRPELLPEMRRRSYTENVTVWQAVTQLGMKLDKVLDKVNGLENRIVSLESKNMLAQKQCQKLGTVVQYMFSALISSQDQRIVNRLNFLPRYIVPETFKQNAERVAPGKRRVGDVADSSTKQSLLTISTNPGDDGNHRVILRKPRFSLDPLETGVSPSTSSLESTVDMPAIGLVERSRPAQCGPLVVRNPTFANANAESPLLFSESSMDQLSRLLADYKTPDDMSDLVLDKSNADLLSLQNNTVLDNKADCESEEPSTSSALLPKWTSIDSPQLFDFNDDSLLNACDIPSLYSALNNSQSELDTPKAIGQVAADLPPLAESSLSLTGLYPGFEEQNPSADFVGQESMRQNLTAADLESPRFDEFGNYPVQQWKEPPQAMTPTLEATEPVATVCNSLQVRSDRLSLVSSKPGIGDDGSAAAAVGNAAANGEQSAGRQLHTSTDPRNGRIIRFMVVPRQP